MSNPELRRLVDAFEDVLCNTLQLARGIDDEGATRPTDCPGWTVHDQLSHMVGLEQVLSGSPAPTIELPPLAHVASDFAQFMERQVHVRRGLPLAAVADELAGLLPRRMTQLSEALRQGDPEVPGAFGNRKFSASMPIRVFDLWAHEQDIRRALGLAPRVDCVAAEVSKDRTLTAWSSTLPTKVTGVDANLVIAIAGASLASSEITLGVGGPVTYVSGDVGVMTWLGCGRGRLGDVRAQLTIDGDARVIDAITPVLGFTP